MAAVRLPKAAIKAWYLDFDDGRSMMLDDNLIVGRDPAATSGETGANLLALGDEGRSVSKTHLRLDAGPLWYLVDRGGMGNRPSAASARCTRQTSRC